MMVDGIHFAAAGDTGSLLGRVVGATILAVECPVGVAIEVAATAAAGPRLELARIGRTSIEAVGGAVGVAVLLGCAASARAWRLFRCVVGAGVETVCKAI